MWKWIPVVLYQLPCQTWNERIIRHFVAGTGNDDIIFFLSFVNEFDTPFIRETPYLRFNLYPASGHIRYDLFVNVNRIIIRKVWQQTRCSRISQAPLFLK